jgi:peptide/nickel transport system permease protein
MQQHPEQQQPKTEAAESQDTISSLKKKKPDSQFKIIVSQFLSNKIAVIGAVILLFIIIAAVTAPYTFPYNPTEQDLLNRLAEPSSEFWMGTDNFGRDIFKRVLHGARVSLTVGFLAMFGAVTIGTVVGALAGYFGGKVDAFLMRLVDILIAFPNIFLLITLVSIFRPGTDVIIFVLASLGWMSTARLVRGEFLSLRTREFVLAARTIGVKSHRIIFAHILPNAIGPIIVTATLTVGNIIIVEYVLSFLGLGVQPPTPSWGNMLQAAQDFTIMRTAWWFPFFPGLMIVITVMCFNFVGDGLRDAFDPKMKQ